MPATRPAPIARLLARLLARVRFALARPRLHVGDAVVTVVTLRYRARVAPDHLPAVPAGTPAVIRAIAPMPGTAGGAIIDLLDMTGRPSGFWTGAALDELRAAEA